MISFTNSETEGAAKSYTSEGTRTPDAFASVRGGSGGSCFSISATTNNLSSAFCKEHGIVGNDVYISFLTYDKHTVIFLIGPQENLHRYGSRPYKLMKSSASYAVSAKEFSAEFLRGDVGTSYEPKRVYPDKEDPLVKVFKFHLPLKYESLKRSDLVENTVYKDIPGIYNLYTADDILCYIGRGPCIRERCLSHFKDKDMDSEIHRVDYSIVTDVADQRAFETKALAEYKSTHGRWPKWNKNGGGA